MNNSLDNNLINIKDITLDPAQYISATAILKKIIIAYKYEEGKRTDVVEAIRYLVVNPENLCTFSIKVPAVHPIMSIEEFESRTENIRVSIPVDKVVIKPYKIEKNNIAVSIVAPSIALVKKSAQVTS